MVVFEAYYNDREAVLPGKTPKFPKSLKDFGGKDEQDCSDKILHNLLNTLHFKVWMDPPQPGFQDRKRALLVRGSLHCDPAMRPL